MFHKDVDTERVIEEVQRRPVLWDPTHALHKDSEAQTEAWVEVYEALYPDYNEMEDAKKKELIDEKLIQQRWKTARDTYIRSQKFKRRGIDKKSYRFSNVLRFLDKIIIQVKQEEADSSNSDVTPNFVECAYEVSHDTPNTYTMEIKLEPQDPESSKPEDPFGQVLIQDVEELIQEPFGLEPLIFEPLKLEPDDIEEPVREDNSFNHSYTSSSTKKQRILRKRKLANSNDNNLQNEMKRILKENSKLLKNDDLAFCMSILPITKDFTVQQKLNFRSEVLKIASKVSKIPQHETNSDSEDSSLE